MVANPPQHPSGDYVLDTNNYLSLIDPKQPTQETLTYSGIAVLHPKLFQDLSIEKIPLAGLFKPAIKQKQITAELYRGEWSDIGTVSRLKKIK